MHAWAPGTTRLVRGDSEPPMIWMSEEGSTLQCYWGWKRDGAEVRSWRVEKRAWHGDQGEGGGDEKKGVGTHHHPPLCYVSLFSSMSSTFFSGLKDDAGSSTLQSVPWIESAGISSNLHQHDTCQKVAKLFKSLLEHEVIVAPFLKTNTSMGKRLYLYQCISCICNGISQ